ncbi:UBL3 [Drosophila busckii]|uniref:UBL3 n=2 Tax=Drosophila busckii TaxID=30019 RepID=A0A0M3QZN9_DROBS|nr:UBL3 [Drosophila busckii]
MLKQQASMECCDNDDELVKDSQQATFTSSPSASASVDVPLQLPPTQFCCNKINANVIPLITHKAMRTIPSDKINLRLILVCGKTKEFLFNPSDSAGDIAQTVFENWPEDWSQEAVSKAEILRLIYQGRFLHCNVTLGALGLPLGKTTVMHLVPRDNLPEPNSQDQRQKSKGGSGRCCSTNCCIL